MPPNPSQRPSGTPPLHYDTQTVRRDADYDIEFKGALLASDSYCSDGERFTEVDLFVTESGRFVAAVRFGSHTRTTMRHDAQVCDNPEEVVKVGQRVEVRIIKIDTDERKIGLTLIQAHFEEGEEGDGGGAKEAERPQPTAPTLGSLANQLKGIGQRVSAREAAEKKDQ